MVFDEFTNFAALENYKFSFAPLQCYFPPRRCPQMCVISCEIMPNRNCEHFHLTRTHFVIQRNCIWTFVQSFAKYPFVCRITKFQSFLNLTSYEKYFFEIHWQLMPICTECHCWCFDNWFRIVYFQLWWTMLCSLAYLLDSVKLDR